MNNSIVLTVIAADRPGVIQTVSSVLDKHGGSWTQSSMSSLAGQFAGILLATVPVENTDACLAELHGLKSSGMNVMAHVSSAETAGDETERYQLQLVGNDHPGIVHDISTVLANHGVNVHDLETLVEAASMGGGELFRASASLVVPSGTDIDALEHDLEKMANDLMVDIRFEK